MTEKTLYQAFDLQKFAPSDRLQAVINASHARTGGRNAVFSRTMHELDDDELELVSAAGMPKRPEKSEGTWE